MCTAANSFALCACVSMCGLCSVVCVCVCVRACVCVCVCVHACSAVSCSLV